MIKYKTMNSSWTWIWSWAGRRTQAWGRATGPCWEGCRLLHTPGLSISGNLCYDLATADVPEEISGLRPSTLHFYTKNQSTTWQAADDCLPIVISNKIRKLLKRKICLYSLAIFYALTLFLPGEVKVDLADFKDKLQKNLFFILLN